MKDEKAPGKEHGLTTFKDGAATKIDFWNTIPLLSSI
jgi:hypothetical protein